MVALIHVNNIKGYSNLEKLKNVKKTEISSCMAIMLDHPWQSLYTQYYRTVCDTTCNTERDEYSMRMSTVCICRDEYSVHLWGWIHSEYGYFKC